jgi:hypothetical protein
VNPHFISAAVAVCIVEPTGTETLIVSAQSCDRHPAALKAKNAAAIATARARDLRASEVT